MNWHYVGERHILGFRIFRLGFDHKETVMSGREILKARAKRCLSERGGDDLAQPALLESFKGGEMTKEQDAQAALGRGLQEAPHV